MTQSPIADGSNPKSLFGSVARAVQLVISASSIAHFPSFQQNNHRRTVVGRTQKLIRRTRRGITMVESLMAVTIVTIAGAALLTSVGVAVRTSSDSSHIAVATGLAEQLMDEISATRFPYGTATVPTIFSNRLQFDDIDDYADWSAVPPIDRPGHVIGTEGYILWGYDFLRLYQMRLNWDLINQFTRTVMVERVTPDGTGGWTVQTPATDFRRVTVSVSYTDTQSNTRTLASISRIFSYVPVTP